MHAVPGHGIRVQLHAQPGPIRHRDRAVFGWPSPVDQVVLAQEVEDVERNHGVRNRARHVRGVRRLRVGSVFHQLNFGLLTIDWRPEPAVVDLQILDVRGAVVRSARLYAPADSSFRSSP